MLDRVKDRFDLHPKGIIADTMDGLGPVLGWLVDQGIAKTKQYGISMRLRKKVEMFFTNLKRILGLG